MGEPLYVSSRLTLYLNWEVPYSTPDKKGQPALVGQCFPDNGSEAVPTETSNSCPHFYPQNKNHFYACLYLCTLSTTILALSSASWTVPSHPSWEALILRPSYCPAIGQCPFSASFHNSCDFKRTQFLLYGLQRRTAESSCTTSQAHMPSLHWLFHNSKQLLFI